MELTLQERNLSGRGLGLSVSEASLEVALLTHVLGEATEKVEVSFGSFHSCIGAVGGHVDSELESDAALTWPHCSR